ncbi:MAG: RNA 2',3'-cyclic phosphodiesterase [Acidobacteriota bacterium]
MAVRPSDPRSRPPHARASSAGGPLRAFLAVEIDEGVRRSLSDVIQHLSPSTGRVKWVEPHQIHVTLKFFAALTTQARSAVEAALDEIAPSVPPIPLAVRGLGAFRSGARIRVLWAGLEDPSNRLSALQASLEQALQVRGIPREERPFRPHLTLGRFREPSAEPRLEDLLRGLRTFDAGAFEADRVTLFHSTLTPAGPRYGVLRHWPLGGER